MSSTPQGSFPGTSISPAEFSTHYGNYSESIRTHELDNYAHAYAVILIILFVILIIILVAISINLDNIAQDLQKKVVIPVIQKMESAESKLAAMAVRTSEMADRMRDWDDVMRNIADPETVQKGKRVLDTFCT